MFSLLSVISLQHSIQTLITNNPQNLLKKFQLTQHFKFKYDNNGSLRISYIKASELIQGVSAKHLVTVFCLAIKFSCHKTMMYLVPMKIMLFIFDYNSRISHKVGKVNKYMSVRFITYFQFLYDNKVVYFQQVGKLFIQ